MNPPCLYAVGVGPGDPELLTLKAVRVLRAADVVIAPTGSADTASYALGIVAAHLDRGRQLVVERLFPMSRDEAVLRPRWEEAAAEAAAHVRAGRSVAFVTIGDPLLYSTFLYLYDILRRDYPDVPISIVPGITSLGAAAAAAGLPLVLGDERLAILPATLPVESLRGALAEFDCVVLLKVSRVYDRLYALLQELGLERHGLFVRRVGSADEEVVSDLAALVGQKLDYLSLLIVRKVSQA